MPHYICKGEGCMSVSDRPNVCMNSHCINKYKLLDECHCGHRGGHVVGISVEKNTTVERKNIDLVNFGLAVGVPMALGIFILGIASQGGWGSQAVSILSSVYIGYSSTLLGSIAGGLWALIDGFIVGVLIAWIYNVLGRLRAPKFY